MGSFAPLDLLRSTRGDNSPLRARCPSEITLSHFLYPPLAVTEPACPCAMLCTAVRVIMYNATLLAKVSAPENFHVALYICIAVRIASGSTVLVDGVTSTSSAVEHQLLAGMHLTSYK